VVVGFCGRLDEDKGVLDLIEAVRVVRTRVPHKVTLALLGSGALSSHVRRIAGREGWLRVTDAVDHPGVPDFLRSLDIFAFPSKAAPDHEEHDAHTLIEAMACGLPCIGTDVGRIPEILKVDCGVLIRRHSSEALADALEALICRPQWRASLGERARSMVGRNFSLDKLAERKAAIIREVIGK
jgi:glycosyltransferase involved in cell wall biosynthesis